MIDLGVKIETTIEVSYMQGCSLVGDKIAIELDLGNAYHAYAYTFGSTTSDFFFYKKNTWIWQIQEMLCLLAIEIYMIFSLFFKKKKNKKVHTHDTLMNLWNRLSNT